MNINNSSVRNTSNQPSTQPDTKKINPLELNNDAVTSIINFLPPRALNNFAAVSSQFNTATYSLPHNHTFHLDLSKYKNNTDIHRVLTKLEPVEKIKITHIKDKINMLTQLFSQDTELTLNAKKCDLSGNQLDTEEFKIINRALLSKMTNLTSLKLTENNIGDDGARDIAQTEHLNQLTFLDLSRNNIGDDGATAIAQSEHLNQLTFLGLSGNNIGDDGATAIAQSEHMSQLKTLIIFRNNIGDDGARGIAQSNHFKQLTSLILFRNNIGNTEATALRERFPFARL